MHEMITIQPGKQLQDVFSNVWGSYGLHPVCDCGNNQRHTAIRNAASMPTCYAEAINMRVISIQWGQKVMAAHRLLLLWR